MLHFSPCCGSWAAEPVCSTHDYGRKLGILRCIEPHERERERCSHTALCEPHEAKLRFRKEQEHPTRLPTTYHKQVIKPILSLLSRRQTKRARLDGLGVD